MKKITFIALLTVFVSMTSQAREVTGKIVDLVTWNDGHSAIKLDNSPINGCAGQYYYSLGIKGQDIKAEPMLAQALAAYMANRTVHILSSDGICQGGQEKLVSINILPN